MKNRPANRPGPESTLDDVREQLLDAGLRLLEENGVGLSFEDISLSRVIEAAGVPRSTAYRSLGGDEISPQSVLHRELQRIVMQRHRQPQTMKLVQAAIAEVLERDGAALTDGDVCSRTRLLREIIRAGANASYANVVESTERAILTSLYGALRSSGQSDWRTQAMIEGELSLNEMFTDLYKGLAEVFRYQVKPDFTFEQLATSAVALVEGIAMRHGFNPHAGMTQLPTGPGGETREWSLYAIGFESLTIGMLEPQNPNDPFADLLHY